MLTCSRVFDVALCGVKVKYAALSPSLVGHPCSITRQRFASGPETHRTMDAKELFIICKGWCRRGTGQVKYISWQ